MEHDFFDEFDKAFRLWVKMFSWVFRLMFRAGAFRPRGQQSLQRRFGSQGADAGSQGQHRPTERARSARAIRRNGQK